MARKHKEAIEIKDDDVDLNPLIDVITMLIIFFIMGGRLSQDIRSEKVTVPPTKTATKIDPIKGWGFHVVSLFGETSHQDRKGNPTYHIRLDSDDLTPGGAIGVDNYVGYQNLRKKLDQIYAHADREPDPKGTGLQLPKVVVELRADSDCQYRVVQEVEQILTDTIDPFKDMTVKVVDPKDLKPFVNINFTARKPGDGARD